MDCDPGNLLCTIIVNNSPFTTVDNTNGETTVMLGKQQLWSDANAVLIFAHRVFWNPKISLGEHMGRIWMWQQNQQSKLSSVELTMPNSNSRWDRFISQCTIFLFVQIIYCLLLMERFISLLRSCIVVECLNLPHTGFPRVHHFYIPAYWRYLKVQNQNL